MGIKSYTNMYQSVLQVKMYQRCVTLTGKMCIKGVLQVKCVSKVCYR